MLIMFRLALFLLFNIWFFVGSWSMEYENYQPARKIYGDNMHNQYDEDVNFEQKSFLKNQNRYNSFSKQIEEKIFMDNVMANSTKKSLMDLHFMLHNELNENPSLDRGSLEERFSPTKLNSSYTDLSIHHQHNIVKKRNEEHRTSNDVFFDFGVDDHEIEVRSDFSSQDDSLEFSSEYNAQTTEKGNLEIDVNNFPLHKNDDVFFTDIMTTNNQNSMMISRLSDIFRKRIKIISSINYTAATEDVCVICLNNFDDCPQFQVNLMDPVNFKKDKNIHKLHHSQWHKECILQWIEFNSKQKKSIYCPLCQQKLKDPRIKKNFTTDIQNIPNNGISLWERSLLIIFVIMIGVLIVLIEMSGGIF